MKFWIFNLTPFTVAFALYFIGALIGMGALLLGERGRRVVWGAYAAIVLAFVFHTWLIADRWIAGGHPPFSGLFDAVILFSWTMTACTIVAEIIFRTRWMPMFLGVTELAFLMFASDQDRSVQPLMPVLQSTWLNIHVVCYMIAYAVMALAFFATVCYYWSLLKTKDLEWAASIDKLTYRLVAFGFPLLTGGLITGAVWANQTWNRYWGWDPKETWSLISWIVFAVYLHFRFLARRWSMPRWKRSAALNWLVVLGFSAIVFTFLLLKYLPSAEQSKHTYM